MLRDSAAAETAGVPTVSLVCEGFVGQANTTATGLGLSGMQLAMVPGHVDVQSAEELRRNVIAVTVDAVVKGLTGETNGHASTEVQPSPRDIVFSGSFEEVNRFFYENEWSDGLPIVPPTIEKVEQFLRFTERSPDESLGPILPDNRTATVWSVAVNGVMAGCRPEYMPVLLALTEAMADPEYGVEHSGNTPGAETLIILNGPIIKQLGFNYQQGVLRDGFQANTSVGRFWRLYLRNIAGFLPHKTDKGTFGNTWRVVLAENEEALNAMGWEPCCTDFGCKPGDNTVTISRYTGGDVIASVFGENAERVMPYLADAVAKQIGWELAFTVGMATSSQRPLLILSPIIAKTIAASGWSRRDVKQYLFEHARIPASKFEQYIGKWTHLLPENRTLVDYVNTGKAPRVFAESSDPARMVPIVGRAEDFMLAVSGDPLRTNGYTFAHNGILGYPVCKPIRLPANWPKLLDEAKQTFV
ncbi:MAG TPA: UGSC family (seleno)protein [Candidatus Binataceae bacterium]|nr:UGSC family (seleno)protein [Candidatus Binataceae bacterium]